MYQIIVYYFENWKQKELFQRKIEKYDYANFVWTDIKGIIEKYFKLNACGLFRKPFNYKLLIMDEKTKKSKELDWIIK